jgi:tRNA threonylcarbamoyladenosine modification (KEOPS) complex Cgi121 subunit
MRKAEVDGKQIIVEGFRNVKIIDVEAFLKLAKERVDGCHIQFFDAGLIAGFDHLYFAALNAVKAFDAGRNISKDLAVEILLYASGQHQIEKAIQLLGIKSSSSQVAVLVLADSSRNASKALENVAGLLQGVRCDEIVEMTDDKVVQIKKTFNLKDAEIEATLRNSEREAVTSLLVERAALLAAQT